MKRVILLTVLALILSVNNVGANETKGFYVGLGYGNMKYGDDGLASSDLDSKNSGMKFYLGFQLNKMASLELSHTDFGEYSSRFLTQDFKETKLSTNLGYFIKSLQLKPFINLGLGFIQRDITGGYPYEVDEDGIGLAYGIGLLYEPHFLKGAGIRVGYDSTYFVQEIQGGYYMNDTTYEQSLDMTYIALQYKF